MVWQELDFVGELLADGRPHLCGERFTAADLTFAALSAAVIAPPVYGVPLPQPDVMPPDTRDVRESRPGAPRRALRARALRGPLATSQRRLSSPIEAAPMRDRAKPVLWAIVGLLPALLLAAHPPLTLFEENQTELPLAVIWQPLGITFAVTAVLYGVLMLTTRSWAKAGALTALAVLWFFFYATFRNDTSGLHLSGGVAVVLWTVVCAAAAVALARTPRGLGNLVLGVGVAALVLTLSPALKIASFQHRHPAVKTSDARLWAADPLPPPASAAKRPDIYVLIPDDYARADVLRRYFHHDNAPSRPSSDGAGSRSRTTRAARTPTASRTSPRRSTWATSTAWQPSSGRSRRTFGP